MRLEFQPIAKGSTVEIVASRRPDLIGRRMTVARFIKSRAAYLLYPLDDDDAPIGGSVCDAWEAYAENVRKVGA